MEACDAMKTNDTTQLTRPGSSQTTFAVHHNAPVSAAGGSSGPGALGPTTPDPKLRHRLVERLKSAEDYLVDGTDDSVQTARELIGSPTNPSLKTIRTMLDAIPRRVHAGTEQKSQFYALLSVAQERLRQEIEFLERGL